MRYHRLPAFAAGVAVAALSLLAAGCGGGGSPNVANITSSTVRNATGSSAITSGSSALLVLGRCLRQHGLADLPDPSIASSGPAEGQAILDKGALRAFSQSVVTNAMAACSADLQKAGIGNASDSARTPEEIQDGLAFARCMRRHGISNFPDPTGQGKFNLAGTGINEHSLTQSQLAAARACLSTAHGALHIPTQGSGSSNNGQ